MVEERESEMREKGCQGWGVGTLKEMAWLRSIWDQHAKEGMWQFDNSLGAGILAIVLKESIVLWSTISFQMVRYKASYFHQMISRISLAGRSCRTLLLV